MKNFKYLLITTFILACWVLAYGVVYQTLLKFGIASPLPFREETVTFGFVLFFLFTYRLVTGWYKETEDLNKVVLTHLLAFIVVLLAYGVSKIPTMLIDMSDNLIKLME